MKKHILFGILLLAAATPTIYGRPAKPGVIKEVTQPDGSTIQVKVIGDEHFHYYTDINDQPLWPDENGRLQRVSYDKIERIAAERITPRMEQRRIASTATTYAVSDETWRGVGLFDEKFPHTGDPHTLIILVEFSDVKFTVKNPKEYYISFLNEEGFSQDKGTGSCRDYFTSVSMGQFTPYFDVYGPVTVNSQAYYGANDRWGNDLRPEQMVIDACKALDSEIDFSQYDTNNDGAVDNIYIFYAGQGEADYGSEDTIWPHQWELSAAGKSFKLDGKTINKYGCCNEWGYNKVDGIGAFCHEFGHVIGLPDLYSYSTSSTDYKATPGSWDIMDSGSYNNDSRTPPSYSAFERNALGWIDLEVLSADKEYVLEQLNESNKGYIVPTNKSNEFFLFENRQKTGWDKYIPGHGMLIWHIDYNRSVWFNNSVNDKASHQYVDIEEANGKVNNLSTTTMAGYSWPGTSKKTEFSDVTTPNMLTWAGKESGLIISNISEANSVIKFKVLSTSGIEDITTDATDEVGVLYTLQGVKVEGQPTPGIYLRRTANTVEKIIVKP